MTRYLIELATLGTSIFESPRDNSRIFGTLPLPPTGLWKVGP